MDRSAPPSLWSVIAETLPEPEHFVHATDVLVKVAILVVAMLASVAAYHAMQRPRLVVSEVEPGIWRAKRRDVIQYVISIPLLLVLWMAGLELVLVFTNNGLSGPDVSVIAVAIVIAVRILAHALREHAHELAKTVPLTIVTLWVITANGIRVDDQTLSDWDRTALTGPTELLLVGTEFVVCALWYWVGVRWWWPKGHDLIGMPRHRHLAQQALLASADLTAAGTSPAPSPGAAAEEDAADPAPVAVLVEASGEAAPSDAAPSPTAAADDPHDSAVADGDDVAAAPDDEAVTRPAQPEEPGER